MIINFFTRYFEDKHKPLDHRPVFAIFSSKRRDLRGVAEAGGLDIKLDFRGADLSGIDLSTDDLRGFDLSNANLRGTGIENAKIDATTKLRGASFDNNIEVVRSLDGVLLSKIIPNKTFSDLMKIGDQAMAASQPREATHAYNRARKIALIELREQSNHKTWLTRYATVSSKLAKAFGSINPNASAWHDRKHSRIQFYRNMIQRKPRRHRSRTS